MLAWNIADIDIKVSKPRYCVSFLLLGLTSPVLKTYPQTPLKQAILAPGNLAGNIYIYIWPRLSNYSKIVLCIKHNGRNASSSSPDDRLKYENPGSMKFDIKDEDQEARFIVYVSGSPSWANWLRFSYGTQIMQQSRIETEAYLLGLILWWLLCICILNHRL